MFQPIGDHVLVRPLSKEEKTKSGLFLPDSAQEKPQSGTVVAVGHGKYFGEKLITFAEMGIKEGVTVMFTKYGPTEVQVDGEDLVILDANDILGITA